jgi:16S rRNA processing protein RimM
VSSSEIVVLGRLADPYGILGWIRMFPFGDDPQAWAAVPKWWVAREGEPWRECGLKGLKIQGKGWVVALDCIPDRSTAESMKGVLVGLPRDALPATKADEFYWSELIGLQVINVQGEVLGKVDGLLETGANSVLRVIADDKTERLLPFVASVVLTVERDAGLIRVEWGSDW